MSFADVLKRGLDTIVSIFKPDSVEDKAFKWLEKSVPYIMYTEGDLYGLPTGNLWYHEISAPKGDKKTAVVKKLLQAFENALEKQHGKLPTWKKITYSLIFFKLTFCVGEDLGSVKSHTELLEVWKKCEFLIYNMWLLEGCHHADLLNELHNLRDHAIVKDMIHHFTEKMTSGPLHPSLLEAGAKTSHCTLLAMLSIGSISTYIMTRGEMNKSLGAVCSMFVTAPLSSWRLNLISDFAALWCEFRQRVLKKHGGPFNDIPISGMNRIEVTMIPRLHPEWIFFSFSAFRSQQLGPISLLNIFHLYHSYFQFAIDNLQDEAQNLTTQLLKALADKSRQEVMIAMQHMNQLFPDNPSLWKSFFTRLIQSQYHLTTEVLQNIVRTQEIIPRFLRASNEVPQLHEFAIKHKLNPYEELSPEAFAASQEAIQYFLQVVQDSSAALVEGLSSWLEYPVAFEAEIQETSHTSFLEPYIRRLRSVNKNIDVITAIFTGYSQGLRHISTRKNAIHSKVSMHLLKKIFSLLIDCVNEDQSQVQRNITEPFKVIIATAGDGIFDVDLHRRFTQISQNDLFSNMMKTVVALMCTGGSARQSKQAMWRFVESAKTTSLTGPFIYAVVEYLASTVTHQVSSGFDWAREPSMASLLSFVSTDFPNVKRLCEEIHRRGLEVYGLIGMSEALDCMMNHNDLVNFREAANFVVPLFTRAGCPDFTVNEAVHATKVRLQRAEEETKRYHELTQVWNWCCATLGGDMITIRVESSRGSVQDTTPLRRLSCEVVELRSKILLDDETLRSLDFFVGNKLTIFDRTCRHEIAKVQKSAEGGGARASRLFEVLAQAIRETVKRLNSIIDKEDQSLQDLKSSELKDILLMLRGKREEVQRNLKFIYEFFSGRDATTVDASHRTKRFQDAIQILQLHEHIPPMKAFVMKYVSEAPDLNCDLLTTMMQVKLKDASQYQGDVQKLIQGMRNCDVEFVAACHEATPVIEFFRQQSQFLDQYRVVQAELMGNAGLQVLLENFHLAYTVLERVLPTAPRTKFSVLVKGLKEMSELDVMHVIKALETCRKNVGEISKQFACSGAFDPDRVLSIVQRFLESDSTFEYTTTGLIALRGGHNMHLPAELLADQIKAAVFVSRERQEDVTEEHRAILSDFVTAYECALEWGRLISEARLLGFPEYHEGSTVRFPCRMDAHSVRSFCDETRQKVERWKGDISELQGRIPRITMLTGAQVRILIENVEKGCTSVLAALLAQCFPDIREDVDLDLVSRLLDNLNVEFAKAKGKIRGSLGTAAALLAVCQQNLDLLLEKSPPAHHDIGGHERVVVINTPTHDNTTILKCLYSFLQRSALNPLNSQILWARASTARHEVESFLSRVTAMPHVKFAVVGVDALVGSAKDTLVELVLRLRTTAGLALVFAHSNRGNESFLFLKEDLVTSKAAASLQLRNLIPSGLKSTPKVHLVTGPSQSGKSHYIAAQAHGSTVVRFPVHEGFTGQSVVSWYMHHIAASAVNPKITFHFDVAQWHAHAADIDNGDETEAEHRQLAREKLHEFSRLVEGMLLHGVVSSVATGDVVAMDRAVEHTIFVELPDMRGIDMGTMRDARTHLYADHIPLAMSCTVGSGQIIRTLTYRLDVTPSLRKAHKMASLVMSAGAANTMDADPSISSERILEEMDRWAWKHPAWNKKFDTNASRMWCVKLLCQRLDFLTLLLRESTAPVQPESFCATFFLQQKISATKNFFHIVAKFFFEESIKLATLTDRSFNELEGSLSVRGHRSLHDFTMLALSARTDEQANKLTGTVFSTPYKPKELGQLRAAIYPAFDLPDSNYIIRAAQIRNYVVTADFATKLIVLNERRRIRAPLILKGHTGTGKTEMLNLLSDLLCHDQGLTTDFGFEFTKIVTGDRSSGTPGVASAYFGGSRRAPTDPLQLAEVLSRMYDDETIEHAVILGIEREIVLRLRDLYQRYPAVEVTPRMRSIFARLVVEDDEDMQPKPPFTQEEADGWYEAEDDEVEARFLFRGALEFVQFAKECIQATPVCLFHRIEMHESIDVLEFRTRISRIVAVAEEYTRMGKNVVVIGFIDELNTSSLPGLVKEVMIDNNLDGKPLPANIFWVGAINPSHSGTEGDDVRRSASNFTGVHRSIQHKEYIVHPTCNSLDHIMMDYGSLSSQQIKMFIDSYLREHPALLGCLRKLPRGKDEDFFSVIEVCIVESMQFFTDVADLIHRVKVSIRDIVRTVQLFTFFLDPKYERFEFLPTTEGARPEERCWLALLLTLGLVFFLRLSTDLRNKYKDRLESAIRGHPLHHNIGGYPFEQVWRRAVEKLWRRSENVGYVRTMSIMENYFANVVCVEACIPLIICGAPGTGKTLSYTITQRNMKGPSSPREDFQKDLHEVYTIVYQCSELSTASEIRGVYEAALARYNRLSGTSLLDQERTVVFLDEAGLPPERRGALKVLHYYLDKDKSSDRPRIATVMLTNETLDAAKTNRAVQVLQRDASTEDLALLVAGCLFTGEGVLQEHIERAAKSSRFIQGLCEAFTKASRQVFGGVSYLYHLRDLLYCARLMKLRTPGVVHESQPIDAKIFQEALRMNFSGVSRVDFINMVSEFEKDTGLNFPEYDFPNEDAWETLQQCNAFLPPRLKDAVEQLSIKSFLTRDPQVVNTLRDVMTATLEDSARSDPSRSAFRHVMIIDTSNTNCVIPLLQDLGILNFAANDVRKETVVVELSDFPEDRTDVANSSATAKVRHSVEVGNNVLLAHCEPIHSAFYDFFNKNYTVINKGGDKGIVYMTNISLGSFSRICVVDPNCHMIVHVSLQSLASIPRPFLSRFITLRVGVEDVLVDRLNEFFLKVPRSSDRVFPYAQIVYDIWRGVQHFVDFLGPEAFYGLTQDTVPAIILSVLLDPQSVPTASCPYIRSPYHKDVATIIENDWSTDSRPQRKMRRYIRACNYLLIQYMVPSTVLRNRHRMPRDYIEEYVNHQEHFNARAVVDDLCSRDQGKWVIYTRACAELQTYTEPHVLHMHSIRSQAHLHQELKRVLGGMKKLVLVVEYPTVLRTQITTAMHIIDEMKTGVVVILIHFSPEATASPVFDTVPLRGWDFMYTDSFATKSSTAEVRKWMSIVFGLQRAPTMDEVCEYFRPRLLEEMRNVKLSVHAARPLHKVYSNAARASDFVTQLLEKNTVLLDLIVGKVARAWNLILMKSQEEAFVMRDDMRLQSKLSDVLSRIHNGLGVVVRGFAVWVIKLLCDGYNMVAFDKESLPRSLTGYMVKLCNVLEPPHLVHLSTLTNPILIDLKYSKAPSLPLYHKLQWWVQAITRKFEMDHPTNALSEAIRRVSEHRTAREVCEVFQENEALSGLIKDTLLCAQGLSLHARQLEFTVAFISRILEPCSVPEKVFRLLARYEVVDYAMTALKVLKPIDALLNDVTAKYPVSVLTLFTEHRADDPVVIHSLLEKVVRQLVAAASGDGDLEGLLRSAQALSLQFPSLEILRVKEPEETTRNNIVKALLIWRASVALPMTDRTALMEWVNSVPLTPDAGIVFTSWTLQLFISCHPDSGCSILHGWLLWILSMESHVGLDYIPPEVEAFVKNAVSGTLLGLLPLPTVQNILQQILTKLPSAWLTLRVAIRKQIQTASRRIVDPFIPSMLRAALGPYGERQQQLPSDTAWLDALFPPMFLAVQSQMTRQSLTDLAERVTKELEEHSVEDLHFEALYRHSLCLSFAAEFKLLNQGKNQHLLTEPAILTAWAAVTAWCPAYPCVLLSHVADDDTLMWIFSDKDVLRKLRLAEDRWYTPSQSEAPLESLYHMCPMLALPANFSDETKRFASLTEGLRKATSSIEVAAVLRPTSAEEQDELRGMLFLYLYQCSFNTPQHSTAAVMTWLTAQGSTILGILPQEHAAYTLMAAGPVALPPPPPSPAVSQYSLREIFSTQCRDADACSFRHFVINVMAFLLASPRQKCFYHSACFDPHDFVTRTAGLGSDNSLVSKDCGYIMDGITFRHVGPFQDIRRHRALNNAVLWCSYAWAYLLLPAHHPSLVKLCSYVADSRNSYAEYITIRARQFYEVMAIDEVLVQKAIHPGLYTTLALQASPRALRECPECVRPLYPFPPGGNNATLFPVVREAERWWGVAWDSVLGNCDAYVAAVSHSLVVAPKLETVRRGRAALATAQHAVLPLSEDTIAQALHKDGSDADCASFIRHFFANKENIRMMSHLPKMVNLMHCTHRMFLGRMSLDDAKKATIPGPWLNDWNSVAQHFGTFALDCESEAIPVLGETEPCVPAILADFIVQRGDLAANYASKMLEMFCLVQERILNDEGGVVQRILEKFKLGSPQDDVQDSHVDLRFLTASETGLLILTEKHLTELESFLRGHIRRDDQKDNVVVDVSAVAQYIATQFFMGKKHLSVRELSNEYYDLVRLWTHNHSEYCCVQTDFHTQSVVVMDPITQLEHLAAQQLSPDGAEPLDVAPLVVTLSKYRTAEAALQVVENCIHCIEKNDGAGRNPVPELLRRAKGDMAGMAHFVANWYRKEDYIYGLWTYEFHKEASVDLLQEWRSGREEILKSMGTLESLQELFGEVSGTCTDLLSLRLNTASPDTPLLTVLEKKCPLESARGRLIIQLLSRNVPCAYAVSFHRDLRNFAATIRQSLEACREEQNKGSEYDEFVPDEPYLDVDVIERTSESTAPTSDPPDIVLPSQLTPEQGHYETYSEGTAEVVTSNVSARWMECIARHAPTMNEPALRALLDAVRRSAATAVATETLRDVLKGSSATVPAALLEIAEGLTVDKASAVCDFAESMIRQLVVKDEMLPETTAVTTKHVDPTVMVPATLVAPPPTKVSAKKFCEEHDISLRDLDIILAMMTTAGPGDEVIPLVPHKKIGSTKQLYTEAWDTIMANFEPATTGVALTGEDEVVTIGGVPHVRKRDKKVFVPDKHGIPLEIFARLPGYIEGEDYPIEKIREAVVYLADEGLHGTAEEVQKEVCPDMSCPVFVLEGKNVMLRQDWTKLLET